MGRPRPWIVTPHGPLERIDENLWGVEGDVPGIPGLKRRMSIVRRPDGALLFYNAVPLDDPTLAQVRALGEPRDLVVPQHLHMIDAQAFAARLGVRVYAPAATRALVERRVHVDGAFEELPVDASLAIEHVAGFTTREALVTVRSGPRASLLVGDLVLDVRHGAGLPGLVFRLLGFTGDRPGLPLPVRLRVLRDRRALRAQLGRLAAIEGLARVVPSHGPVIDRDPAAVLREIAATL